MKYFTKEQIERLKEASIHFYTAVHENFKRGTMAPLNNLVADIYFEATGEKLNPNWSCNTCCLNNFKTAGRLYFDSIRYWQDQEPAAKNETVETETEPVLKTNELEKSDRIFGAESTDSKSTLQNSESTEAGKSKSNQDKGTFANKPKGRPKGSKKKK